MKRDLKMKAMLCLILTIMTVTLLQNFAFANTDTEKIQIVKVEDSSSSNDYIIYVSGLLDQEFEFAFSNGIDEVDKENLTYVPSAKDSLEDGNNEDENVNNIAYVDSSNYSYFDGKDNTYLWVRQSTEEGEYSYKLEAEEVVLSNALTKTEIEALNDMTKKIEVKVGEMSLPAETTAEGVKVTRKIGTINITPTEGSNYSYQMKKAEQNSVEEQLIKLITELNSLENATIDKKLSVYNQLRDIYSNLEPSKDDTNWLTVENNIIQQDPNSKEDEQYVVWIKEETEAGDTRIDVQIMTCVDEYVPEYEKQEVVIKETTKLPITGDNIALFVIAGVILVLIVAVVVLKLKNKKETK